MHRAQIIFDFMLALGTLSILFIITLSFVQSFNQQSASDNIHMLMERDCEIISLQISNVKTSGPGSEQFIHTKFNMNFSNENTLLIEDSYVCKLPSNCTSLANGSGKFIVKNENGNILILR